MIDLLFIIGTLLAIGGSGISIIGVWYNNILRNHLAAMKIWMFSNVFLMLWSAGNAMGFWNGGLSAAALAVLYSVFTVTNLYGLIHSVCDRCHYDTQYNHCAICGFEIPFWKRCDIFIRGCKNKRYDNA